MFRPRPFGQPPGVQDPVLTAYGAVIRKSIDVIVDAEHYKLANAPYLVADRVCHASGSPATAVYLRKDETKKFGWKKELCQVGLAGFEPTTFYTPSNNAIERKT
jgi:hypothetical protein